MNEFRFYRKRVSWKQFQMRVRILVNVLKHRHMYCMLKYELYTLGVHFVLLFIPGWWADDGFGSMGPFLTREIAAEFAATYCGDRF